MLMAITYIGDTPGKTVRLKGKTYNFEWQKSLGIGKGQEEVEFKHAKTLSKWRDKRGKKIFILE